MTRQAAIARRPALQPQVSPTVRFVAAVAVCSALAGVWIVTKHASHEAVDLATTAINNGPIAAPHTDVQLARRDPNAKRS